MRRSEPLAGAGALARASWVVWRRHTASSLGVRPRAVDAGIALGLVLCAGLAGLVSTVILGAFAATGDLPADVDRIPFTRITAAGAVLAAALPQLLLAATRPRSTALGDLASVLPVGVAARTTGERMPTVLLGFAFAVVLAAPLGVFLLNLLGAQPARAAGAVGAHLVLLAAVALACPAAFELLYGLACRMRLPHGYATGIAAVVLLVAIAALCGPFLVPRPLPEAPFPLSPVEATAQLAATVDPARAAVAGGVLLAWTSVALALGVVAARHPTRVPAAEYTRILTGARLPRGVRAAGVAVHALALVRLPQFLILGLGSVVLAIALATPAARELSALTEPFTGVPLVAPFAIGMFAFGLTHGTSWWVRGIGSDARRITGQRLLASAVVGAVPAAAAAAVLVGTGTTSVGTAAQRLAAGVVLCLAASLGGILVPWSQQSPLSTTLTSAVSFALFALAVVPLQLAVDGWAPPAAEAALAASALLLAAAWAAVTRRPRVDDLTIA
ncbi:MAG: hypothetical protein J0H23_02480 [Micrococcales bacterium]|nr:hypothetical protein [Micrococcales bacterium]OJX66457.1 MAG: hypothetical protein BGO94_06205 [Micrococcales bacterium 72-143]